MKYCYPVAVRKGNSIHFITLKFQSYTSVFTATDQNNRYRPIYNPTAEGGGYQNSVPNNSPQIQSNMTVAAVRRTSSNMTNNLSTICEDSEDTSGRAVTSEETDDRKPILS